MASLLRAAAPRRCGALARREFSALVSPSDEFPGAPSTTPTPTTASTPTVTTLSNGLTVVTESTSTISTLSLTLPNAGSSSEAGPSESGAALVNKHLGFKSGSGLSSAVILRNLENDGATTFVSAGRDGAVIGYTAAKDKAERLIPLLATTCSYESWDLQDAKKSASVEITDATACAQTTLTESIYAAAYGSLSSTGKSLYSAGASIAGIKAFRERAYILNGSVLAATGISDHDAFVSAVETGFSESAVGTPTETTTSPFIGGESRIHAPSSAYTHLAFAFEGPSSTAVSNVMKHCISLASEGAISGFATPGMFGLYGTGAAAEAGTICSSMTDLMTDSLSTVASLEIVERAKVLAKAETIFSMEGGSKSLAESMASAVLKSEAVGVSEVGAAYDAVSAADVSAAFTAMTKGPSAMASVGDISAVPYHGSVVIKLG